MFISETISILKVPKAPVLIRSRLFRPEEEHDLVEIVET
jgi:hypothetical protein